MRWGPAVLLCVCACLNAQLQAQLVTSNLGFNDRFLKARDKLNYSLSHNARDSEKVKVELGELWSGYSAGRSEVLRSRGHTMLLFGDQVSKMSPQGVDSPLNLPIPLLFPKKQMRFLQSIEYHNQLYLLICYLNNQCILFSSSEFQFTYRVTISDSGIPIDAKFFIQRDSLYLIVLYQARDSVVSQSRLYRWHKTSLDDDRLAPEITSTARSLTVFQDQENVVIVLACVGDDRIKFPSQVWLREPNGTMIRVHNLATQQPISITHFVQRGQHFLLVLQDGRQSAVYWWEGREFVFWIPIEENLRQYKVSVSTVRGMPFMLFTQGTHLKIYFMTSVKLEKVYDREHILTASPYKIHSINNVVMYEEKDVFMFIQGSDSAGNMRSYLYRVKMENLHIDGSEGPVKREGWSLNLLLSSVDSLSKQADSMDELVPSLLLTNTPFVTNTTIYSGVAVVRNGNVDKPFGRLGVFKQKQNVRTALIIVREGINECHEKLKSIKDKDKRHILFHGDVHFFRANITSLMASTVNGETFKPESYLSLTDSQRLHEVHAKKLSVHWLALKDIGNSSMKDLLLEDQKINVSLKINGLEFKNLHTRINEDAVIDKLIDSKALLEDHEAPLIGQGPPSLRLSPDSVIEDLYVDTINNVSVQELLSTLFIPYLNNTIKGDVSFEKGLRVDQLVTKDLRETPPAIKLDPVQRLTPLPVNPVQPLGTLAPVMIQPNFKPFPQAPTVYAPQYSYVPHNAYPYNPLYAHPYSSVYPYSSYPATGKRYIRQDSIVLRQHDLSKSKVKILGNLKANRIIFKKSALTTKNGPLPTKDLEKTFWSKNIPQVFPESIYFRNSVSLMNGLSLPIINGNNMSQFFHIERKDGFSSNGGKKINAESNHDGVLGRTNKGDQDTDFQTIEVKHLTAKYINGLPASRILSSHSLKNGKSMITTENLIVKGNLTLNTINGMNLTEKLESAVMSDEDTKLNELNIKSLSARSLQEVLRGRARARREVRALRLRGNLILQSLNVSSVNNKSSNLSVVVNRTKNTVIHGNKTFIGQVQVKSNINVKFINNKNISRLLLKSKDQEITGFYTIRNAKFDSLLNVTLINGEDPRKFVHIDQPVVNLSQDVFFDSLSVNGNITAHNFNDGCKFPMVDGFGRVVFDGQIVTPHLKVGSAQWPEPGGQMSHLFRSAVTSDTNQNITGSVEFTRIEVQYAQVDLLKDKNISHIYEDSLMLKKENQVITGRKHFTGTIKCYQNVEVKKGARFAQVNEINVNDIDKRLVRLTADGHSGTGRVYGKKTFMAGFTAFNLTCEGGVNGIRAEMLARDGGPGPAIPALSVRSLTVLTDLKAESINNLHLNSFLHDIIYLNRNNNQIMGSSLIIMGDVTFKGNLETLSINNISTDELVFVRSDKLTYIKGCKKFFSDLHIETNSSVDYLNNKQLAKTYNKSVKTFQNITINGSLELFDVEIASVFAKEYFAKNRKLVHLNKTLTP